MNDIRALSERENHPSPQLLSLPWPGLFFFGRPKLTDRIRFLTFSENPIRWTFGKSLFAFRFVWRSFVGDEISICCRQYSSFSAVVFSCICPQLCVADQFLSLVHPGPFSTLTRTLTFLTECRQRTHLSTTCVAECLKQRGSQASETRGSPVVSWHGCLGARPS